MTTSQSRSGRPARIARRKKTASRKSPGRSPLAFESLEPRHLLALIVPGYSSLPGAAQSLYLDFDGSPAFDWVGTATKTYRIHGPGGNDAPVPAFSIDGNVNDFSSDELAAIAQVWSDVAEKYSPFNINVTTVVPPNFNDFQAIQMIVGGSRFDWFSATGSAIGVANGGGFTNSLGNQGFAWSQDIINVGSVTLSTVNRELLSETVAHEAGHLFGLEHQSIVDGGGNVLEEYSNGNALGVPIMGNSGVSPNLNKHGIWFNGTATERDGDDNLVVLGTQDDLDRLYALLGPRPDDHGLTSTWTTNDNFGHYTALGNIGGLLDTDGFRFTATGSMAYSTITNQGPLGMLTPRLELRSWPGHTPVSPLWTVTQDDYYQMYFNNLVIGEQYVVVASSNFAYGSLGNYDIYTSNSNDFAVVTEGVLRITGFDNVNDDIQLDVYGPDSDFLYVDNVINGHVISALIPFNSFSSIVIDTKAGDDSVRYRSPIGVYATALDMGIGTDTLETWGSPGADFFDVGATRINFDFTVVNFNSSVERLLTYGFGGTDTFTIGSVGSTSITMNGGDGNDTIIIPSGVISSGGTAIHFAGGADADTLLLDDSANPNGRAFTVTPGHVQVINGGQVRDFEFDGTIETVRVGGGPGTDTFDVQGVIVGQLVRLDGNDGADTFVIGGSQSSVTANGNNGNDTFIVGEGNVGAANYAATLVGGPGNDSLVFDDSLYAGAANWAITGENVQRNTPGLAQVFSYVGFEGVGINTGAGGATANNITTFGAIPVSVSVLGGAGVDNFFINNFANEAAGGPLGSVQLQSLFDGGGGFNSMIIDDSARGILTYNMYPTRLEINEVLADDGEFSFLNIGAMSVTASDSRTTLNVYGTPASVVPGNQTTVLLRGGNDVANVFPHDVEGNLTVTTNIGIVGEAGDDTFTVHDAASAEAINYLFSNPFGGGTQNIFGLGAGGLGTATIEKLIVNAGSGDDTFDVNQYASGTSLTINAGGGNDTLNFGGDDLAANITNIAAFTFNGQEQFDTFNLRNSANATGFTYRRNIGTMSATSGAYAMNIGESGTERVVIDAGSGADVFRITAVATGTQLDIAAGAGFDALLLGDLSFSVGEISGPITFDSGDDAGRVSVTDINSTVGKVAHLDLNSLGAYPGNTLFGPGGLLRFTTLVNQFAGFNFDAMGMSLGSGADTIYAQPFATGTVGIFAGNPVAAPGDTLHLALATAKNFVVNGTAVNGNVTSNNLQTLSYTGFETGPNVDDIAPYIVGQSYDDSGVPTVLVQFSEDVSAALDVSDLELLNTTSGQQVSFADLDVTYDAGTDTASFTFPGYAGGVLPDGEYNATVNGALTDFFGNPLGVEIPLQFAIAKPPPVLPGDFNQDGVVGAADYIRWRNTLGNIVPNYSGADGNGDGMISLDDYDVWKANYGATLPPPAAATGAIELAFADLADETDPVPPTWTGFATISSTATRHDVSFRQHSRTRILAGATPTGENLLITLATDRVRRSAGKELSWAEIRQNENRLHQGPTIQGRWFDGIETDTLLAIVQ